MRKERASIKNIKRTREQEHQKNKKKRRPKKSPGDPARGEHQEACGELRAEIEDQNLEVNSDRAKVGTTAAQWGLPRTGGVYCGWAFLKQSR